MIIQLEHTFSKISEIHKNKNKTCLIQNLYVKLKFILSV